MRLIFRALESDRLLEWVNRSADSTTEVIIGDEFDCLEIRDCSLVIRRFDSQDAPDNTLAIFGPKRMAYSRVIPMVDYLSDLIAEEL